MKFCDVQNLTLLFLPVVSDPQKKKKKKITLGSRMKPVYRKSKTAPNKSTGQELKWFLDPNSALLPLVEKRHPLKSPEKKSSWVPEKVPAVKYAPSVLTRLRKSVLHI